MKMIKRVLCVDDESDVLEAVRLHLMGEEDLELVTYDDPTQALASIEGQDEFALALVDIMMPGMTGIEFMSQLKELSPRTVRINMSSHADLDLVLKALGSNQIYDFIRKPLTREEFFGSVSKGLDHYALRVERDALAESLKEKNALLEDWNQRLDEEVKKKTRELALRDRLMQHLSGCSLLSDPYEVVREFLDVTLGDVPQLILSKEEDEGCWSVKDKSVTFAQVANQLTGISEVGERCGPLTEDELAVWEKSLGLNSGSLSFGEALQYRDGLVGVWFIGGPSVSKPEQEAASRFSALVGLLLYDEITLDRIGELSDSLLG
jgi:FixJ family two-component response regulator